MENRKYESILLYNTNEATYNTNVNIDSCKVSLAILTTIKAAIILNQ